MRATVRRIAACITILSLLTMALALTGSGHPASRTITGAPGEVVNVECVRADGTKVRPTLHQHSTHWSNICPAGSTPTPTATAAPTHTPTPTPGVSSTYHAPGAHDGLNVHEHGDAPPAWVLNSANPPFTQSRESHTGYKGVLDVSPGGAVSYLIVHVLTTEAARSHGDHDYQLWILDPDTGTVTYQAGIHCYADPCTAPTEEKTADDGERPIVLGERSSTDGCETWYSDPGDILADVGWTMCQRYQRFDGTVLGGDGTFRTMDWIVPCDRLPAGSGLADECRIEFGVNRLSFLVNSREYEPAGIDVRPIN